MSYLFKTSLIIRQRRGIIREHFVAKEFWNKYDIRQICNTYVNFGLGVEFEPLEVDFDPLWVKFIRLWAEFGLWESILGLESLSLCI